MYLPLPNKQPSVVLTKFGYDVAAGSDQQVVSVGVGVVDVNELDCTPTSQ